MLIWDFNLYIFQINLLTLLIKHIKVANFFLVYRWVLVSIDLLNYIWNIIQKQFVNQLYQKHLFLQ